MNGESKYGGLSMRNIMIRKKLAERKRFDSADHAMQTMGIKTNDVELVLPVRTDDEGKKAALVISTDAATLMVDDRKKGAVDISVQSPVQIGMAAFFNSMGDTNAEQTMDGMTLSPANRQITNNPADAKAQSKYGALSTRNIILRRKLAQRTKFDSADYQLQKYGHSKMEGVERSSDMDTASPTESEEALSTPPTPVETVPNTAPDSAPNTAPNYGKLCAQNILFRKKLKERKRFDSADYSMENSAAKNNSTNSVNTIYTPPRLDMVDKHQAKHLKVSVDSPKPVNDPPKDQLTPTSRVAARNIVLQRKLQERKRFDSADYFKELQQRN